MIEKLLRFKNKFNNILQSKSHAILLESEDEQLLKDVACLYSVNLLCESENKPCFKCSQCKNIISDDVIIKTLKQVCGIGNLAIDGGEPTLAVDRI